MIVELQDKWSGCSEVAQKELTYNYQYTIDTEKIMYISNEAYLNGDVTFAIHFVNGEKISIHTHSYENIVNKIYNDYYK